MLVRQLLTAVTAASTLSVLTIAFMSSPVRAVVLADTQADFSVVAQGTNGFEYGVYTGPNALVENGSVAFSTANFTVTNGDTWYGGENLGTPALTATVQHPGLSLNPAVRRYTVGSNGEPLYAGLVQIAGRFSDLAGGATGGFVTVDGVNFFNQPVPNTGDATGFVDFDFNALVLPGSHIDFGVTAGADAFSDSTRMVATISIVPEPASLALLLTPALLAVARPRRTRRA